MPRTPTMPCVCSEAFTRSATLPRVSSLKSGCSGSRQQSSPVWPPICCDLLGELVVVREEAGVGRAERDDDRPGQGGEVDDPVGP